MGAERRAAGELRALGGRRVAGTLLRYGDLARLPDGRSERFEAGALDPLPGRLPVNVQHDPALMAGELRLSGDGSAIRGEGEVTAGVHDLIRRGALNGFSVEFRSASERDEGGVRVIERGALLGVGVVDRAHIPVATWRRVKAVSASPGRCLSTRFLTGAGGQAKKVQFARGAFRGVENLGVTVISRGAESVIADTATGSLRLRRRATALWASPSIRSTLRPDAGLASWRRPVWPSSRGHFGMLTIQTSR